MKARTWMRTGERSLKALLGLLGDIKLTYTTGSNAVLGQGVLKGYSLLKRYSRTRGTQGAYLPARLGRSSSMSRIRARNRSGRV
jgi:hypothetical protein